MIVTAVTRRLLLLVISSEFWLTSLPFIHFTSQSHSSTFSLSILIVVITALPLFYSLTENNKPPLQRSCSRQNVNASLAAAGKASSAKESRNESEGHPSAAKSQASSSIESGRRNRNPPGQNYGLERERVVERETLKGTKKEVEVEAEALQPSSSAVSSFNANGESDVEALLAKLRAL